MESVHELLRTRRMCRDFAPDPLDAGVTDRLAEAALGAPAAGNTHALHLVALEGAQTSGYWDVTLTGGAREAFAWPGLLRAPLLLVPYVSPEGYLRRYSEPDKVASGLGADPDDWPVPYWFVDGGAAAMAVLVAARAEGLGALLFGQFGHEGALRRRLGVPEGFRAVGTIAVGHRSADARRSASARRGRPPLGQHLHRGGW